MGQGNTLRIAYLAGRRTCTCGLHNAAFGRRGPRRRDTATARPGLMRVRRDGLPSVSYDDSSSYAGLIMTVPVSFTPTLPRSWIMLPGSTPGMWVRP
jgi:hypothetical protein